MRQLIPWDKSWIIRLGILDLLNGYTDISRFLEYEIENLSSDLFALKYACEDWTKSNSIYVGESGSLFRILQFVSWKLGLNKTFKKTGTLITRKITNDPKIIELPQRELLKLDNGTSQWATAAVLMGDEERLEEVPFKLQLNYEAVDYWKNQRAKSLNWEPRYDETIHRQAETFIQLIHGGHPEFTPTHAEDYCFSRAFNFISRAEGERLWPALATHESNRLVEMDRALINAERGHRVKSRDHRVIQAIGMWEKYHNRSINIERPSVVSKSWPQFWNFITVCSVKSEPEVLTNIEKELMKKHEFGSEFMESCFRSELARPVREAMKRRGLTLGDLKSTKISKPELMRIIGASYDEGPINLINVCKVLRTLGLKMNLSIKKEK